MTQLEKAKAWAQLLHDGQFRNDGVTPYFTHCEAVVDIGRRYYIEKGYSDKSEEFLAGLYLHDVKEDCKVKSLVDLGFYREIDEFVDSLTDPTLKLKFKIDRDLKLRLKLMNTTTHFYGPLGKICDRLHNFGSIVDSKAEGEWEKKQARETLALIDFYYDLNARSSGLYLPFEEALNDLCDMLHESSIYKVMYE